MRTMLGFLPDCEQDVIECYCSVCYDCCKNVRQVETSPAAPILQGTSQSRLRNLLVTKEEHLQFICLGGTRGGFHTFVILRQN